jgi:hypothetical protein
VKLRISVTAEDIQNGEGNDMTRCPLALAIRRAHTAAGIQFHGGVCADHWHPDADDMLTIGRWPADCADQIREFVHGFDRGAPVEPFEFDLEVPA